MVGVYGYNKLLIQVKTHLRQSGAHLVINRLRPKDMDDKGVCRGECFQNSRLVSIISLITIDYSELINLETKNLIETGGFNTVHELLQHLRLRYHSIDEIAEASHQLYYHSLQQYEGKRVRNS